MNQTLHSTTEPAPSPARDSTFKRDVAIALANELRRVGASFGHAMNGVAPIQGGTVFANHMMPAAFVRLQTPTAAVQALQILRQYREWKDNWDAEGAPAPSSEAIDIAQNLLGHLRSFPIDPTAMLDANGNPLLLLKYAGGEGEINVHRNALLDFILQRPDGEPEVEADLPVDADGVPGPLDEALRRLMDSIAR